MGAPLAHSVRLCKKEIFWQIYNIFAIQFAVICLSVHLRIVVI
jgi:hypothetical protein